MGTSETGVRFNVPRAEYEALKRVNWSRLKLLKKSPAHYLHGTGEETAAMRLGTAAHAATLEPDAFVSGYVAYPKRRAGKEFDAFEVAHAGKTILTLAEHSEALEMANAIRTNPVAAKYLQGGNSEVVVTWDFRAPAVGGLPGFEFLCKGRLDYLSPLAIVDVKSTKDASPEGFARQCVNLGIHAQGAYYSDGHFEATGERLPYVLIAVENTAPHVVTVFRLEGDALKQGRDEYQTLLGRLDQCRQTKTWGGYADGEVSLVLPKWATKDVESEAA